MKPMLCHRYKTHKSRITFPCYVQPKLNGIRAIFTLHDYEKQWQTHSRATKETRYWAPNILAHITKQLKDVLITDKNIILDGELYYHGWPLQRIAGAVSWNREEPTSATTAIEYHVFDIVADAPMAERAEALSQLASIYPNVVSTHHVSSKSSAEHYYTRWKRQGYEGMVYRKPEAPYGFLERCGNKENRWDYIIKRKDFASDEFTIIGVKEEYDKHSRPKGQAGALVLETETGQTFSAGSGLSAEQRHKYWKNPPVGLLATIEFEIYSEGGVPLQPRVQQVHEQH
tara:strand:- start:7148 stop:8005 length:858 start_codon:yes stop_codon:yes gene_type:complete